MKDRSPVRKEEKRLLHFLAEDFFFMTSRGKKKILKAHEETSL